MSSYTPYQWTNRDSEFPFRRTLTNVNDSTDVKTVDVTRAEGRIDVQGDSFDANTMNSMEGRIASAFSTVDQAMGNLNNLTTQEKSSLVGAINEVAAGGGGGGSSTLAGLTDTDISSPTNGQVLKYNSTSSKWENAAESGGSEHKLIITYSTALQFSQITGASDFSYVSTVDETGATVSPADVFELVEAGYQPYLKLVIYAGAANEQTHIISLGKLIKYGNAVDGTRMCFAYCDAGAMYFTFEANVVVHPNDTAATDIVFELELINYPDEAENILFQAGHGISAQDVQAAIEELADEKANLASPAFTGSPTAPTASVGHSGTRIATTAFVNNEIDNDTKFHKNATVDLAPAVFAGRIDSDKKTIHFTIPLNKPLGSDITGVTTGGNFSIYTPSGAIFTSSTLASKGTVTHYLREYGIGVRLVLSTAYSTGSTPVSVYCNANNSMTFTGS